MPKKLSQNDKAKIYFELVDEIKKKYKCNIGDCDGIVKAENPSGLVSHIKHVHGSLYRAEINPEILDEKSIALKKLKFIQDCTEVVTVNGRSFSHLADSGLHGMANESIRILREHKAGIDLSGKFTEVKDYIDVVSKKIEEVIKTEVKNRFVSLMCDAGSKNGMSILSMCIQYPIDGVITIRNIGMIRMLKRHRSSYIKELVMNQLTLFEIDKLQVIAFTTDNASNMKATVKLFDDDVEAHMEEEDAEEENETVHETIQNHQFDGNVTNFNLATINEIIRQYDIDDNGAAGADEGLMSFLNDEYSLNDAIESLQSEIKNTTINVNGVPCSAHTLQLAVNEALDLPIVKTITLLCRTAAKLLRRETYVYDLNDVGIKIKIVRMDCQTRWNSTYRMVRMTIIFNLHFIILFLY